MDVISRETKVNSNPGIYLRLLMVSTEICLSPDNLPRLSTISGKLKKLWSLGQTKNQKDHFDHFKGQLVCIYNTYLEKPELAFDSTGDRTVPRGESEAAPSSSPTPQYY